MASTRHLEEGTKSHACRFNFNTATRSLEKFEFDCLIFMDIFLWALLLSGYR